MPSVTLGSVTVQGTAAVGKELRAVVAGVSPAHAAVSHQWLRDGAPVPGATTASYRVALADVGHRFSVRVTATLPEHHAAAATSAATTTVAPVATAVTLSRSAKSQRYASTKPVTLTARVTAPHGVPGGKVAFRDGTKTLATVTVRDGAARYTLPRTLAVGKHTLRAQFVPAAKDVVGATSKAVTVKVVKASAKVTVKLTRSTVKRTVKGRLKVTVSVVGVPRPTGTLVVYEGSKKVTSKVLKAKHQGKVTITLPRLAKGTHKLKVTYRGSSKVAKKTSSTVKLRVR